MNIPRSWFHVHTLTWPDGDKTAFEHAHPPGPHPGISMWDGKPVHTYRPIDLSAQLEEVRRAA